jgi:hypothetical protein
MSLSKSKCWYSNNCLLFLKCAVPLNLNVIYSVLGDEQWGSWLNNLLQYFKFRVQIQPPLVPAENSEEQKYIPLYRHAKILTRILNLIKSFIFRLRARQLKFWVSAATNTESKY